MDQEEIKKNAKQILDSFMDDMKTIDVEDNFILTRDTFYREEGEGKLADDNFKQRFLANAPKISGDAIVTKKGDWVNE